MNDVLIIIPTYNEIENIDKIIKSIFGLYNGVNILVVDDNSPDHTSSKVIASRTFMSTSCFQVMLTSAYNLYRNKFKHF